ncbi:MAG: nucleoside 2-deoxyribosyltransferase [Sedimentisphaerales bacterium]|nr:nucleoside 2-deoxyribosyltransferase [Sedimentisphaerales bacterium]
MKRKIFLNSPLSSLAEQTLNKELKKLIKNSGFDCCIPQEILPPGENVNCIDVLKSNIDSLNECEIIISVLDKPGLGVIFELAYAYAINKEIILFRTDKQDYLGKIIEGFWSEMPGKRRARSLNELKNILNKL